MKLGGSRSRRYRILKPHEGNIMKRALSVALILFVGMAGSLRAEETKPQKDSLPREGTVQWDLQTFEESPAFEVAKREVKGNSVTWVLENKRNLGTEITFGYQAIFLDADGVKVFTIGIETEPFLLNMPKGERNRFVLHLPRQEQWKSIRKVIIKNGLYN
jgi:hypothetical protein